MNDETTDNKPQVSKRYNLAVSLFWLALVSCAQAVAQPHTRFATNRVITVSACPGQDTARNCWQIVQSDAFGRWAPRHYLHGDGNLVVVDMAVNDSDQVAIVGSFSGSMWWDDGSTLLSKGGDDLFYLILDNAGNMMRFGRLGEQGDDRVFAVSVDTWGLFESQGALFDPETMGMQAYRWRLDANSGVVTQEALGMGLPATEEQIIEDDDDDPIEDPIG